MANVIHGGVDAFNAMTFAAPHQSTMNFIQNQFVNLTNMGSALTDYGQQFVNTSMQMVDSLFSHQALQAARNIVKMTETVFRYDNVHSLLTLEELQLAKFTMQRFIMACPEIRTLYHKQQCDGYSETYIDNAPGIIGEGHLEYRQVMSGIIDDVPLDQQSDLGHEWVANIYIDEQLEPDLNLCLDQQDIVLNAWDMVRGYVKAKRSDPTNATGGNF